MADTIVERNRGSSWVAWLALILAIAALTIGWLAYNRAGEDLEDQASDTINSATENADDAANEAGDAAQEGADTVEQGIDTGPDGVDDGAQ